MHPETRLSPHAGLWRRGDSRTVGDVPRAHEELVVLLGLAGRGRYLLDGAEMAIVPGALIWAPAGAAHMLIAGGEGFDMWVLLAHPKLWSGPAPVPMDRGGGWRQLGPGALAEMDTLAEVLAGRGPEARGIGLKWWLTRARQHWDAAAAEQGQRWHPAVARAALMIDRAPDLDLPALAREAGLSAGRLGRLFRAQTGQSVTDFRNGRRLAAVDQGVAEGRALLTAALDAGFGSYAQFYRVFRAARGAAPGVWYRQKERAEASPPRPL